LTVTESALDLTKSLQVDKNLTGVTQTGDYDPGTGADGAIVVSTDTSINATSLISGRSCADGGDAVNYSITSLTTTTATLETPSSSNCLKAGDEVLLISLRGTTSSFDNVGNYETLRVASVANNIVTFSTAKSKFFGDNGGDNNIGVSDSNHAVMLQRVPNYTTVTVSGAGTEFTPDAWVQPTGTPNNGAGEGGVMFFRAAGAVSIGSGASIHANAKGYLAGTGDTNTISTPAQGGEAFCGTHAGGNGSNLSGAIPTNPTCGGGGGGRDISTTYPAPATNGTANLGGAGGGGEGIYSTSTYNGGNGGGGGYGTYGTGGYGTTASGTNGGTNSSGNGGNAITTGSGGGGGGGSYGTADLSQLMFGSSGGGGGAHYQSDFGVAGGNGGGIVYIAGQSIAVSGNLSANGAAGGNAIGYASYGGAGGGGAGGSVKLLGNTLSLGTTLTSITGGSGGTGSGTGGGAGGDGRIAVYYASSISGAPTSAEVAQVPAYNYSMFISDEVPTPNATGYNKISWLADLDSFGLVELQTRSGKSSNSTDGTWEEWKPATTSASVKTLSSANTHTDWVSASAPNDVTVADGGVTRNVDYFENEDENVPGNMTKISSVGSTSGYAETTFSALDLSNSDYLTAWVYATSSGNIVKLGIGESSGNEQEKTFHVQAASTWQKIYWDLTDISATARDGITKVRVSLPSTNTTLYLDQVTADRYLTNSEGSIISSTPNDYFQYRAILTSTNSGYHPTLHNVQIDWSNGFKIVQTAGNSVRLYNYTGESQTMRLDAIVYGADLAEWYTVEDDDIKEGDLVALSGKMDEFGVPILRKTSSQNDRQIIGAISTKAGQTLGLEAANRRLLALAGRVPIKMDLDSPSLVAGDYLTSSNKPGFARKARSGEITIGRAFEAWHHDAPTSTVLSIIQQPIETPEQDLSQMVLSILKDTWEVWDQVGNVQITRLAAFSEVVTGRLTAGLITTDTLKVATISPLATGEPITITAPVTITSPLSDSPALVVDGTIDAATISARVAYLGDIKAENITAKNIIADTITANQIVGLDAKIASMSAGEMTSSEIETITDRIKNRLAELTGDVPTAADIPVPLETINSITPSLTTYDLQSNISTSSADLDFATINNYLAVIGSATITTLDVTNGLFADSLSSKTGKLALADNTLIIDSTGLVTVNGDLTITGKLTASELNLERLNILDETGEIVATIDASGSANLASLTTNMITIASAPTASDSALAELIGSATSNATAGESTLISPNTELTIESQYITPNSLVYLTPTGNTDNKVLFIKSKNSCDQSLATTSATLAESCKASFTVAIDTPAISNISFNWWIIQLK